MQKYKIVEWAKNLGITVMGLAVILFAIAWIRQLGAYLNQWPDWPLYLFASMLTIAIAAMVFAGGYVVGLAFMILIRTIAKWFKTNVLERIHCKICEYKRKKKAGWEQ